MEKYDSSNQGGPGGYVTAIGASQLGHKTLSLKAELGGVFG